MAGGNAGTQVGKQTDRVGLAGGKEGRQVGKQTDRQRNDWVASTMRVGGWECRQTGGQTD